MRFKRTIKILRGLLIVGLSVLVIGYFFKVVGAGSLTPPGIPASTMHSISDIYAAIAGTFDSSAITANSNGDAMQIAKCIGIRVTGGSCP